MLVYYFVPFIVSNRYLLFRDSNGHNSVTVQTRTHVYMNFFDHKDLGKHLLQLCPKVVKHPVYIYIYIYVYRERSSNIFPKYFHQLHILKKTNIYCKYSCIKPPKYIPNLI